MYEYVSAVPPSVLLYSTALYSKLQLYRTTPPAQPCSDKSMDKSHISPTPYGSLTPQRPKRPYMQSHQRRSLCLSLMHAYSARLRPRACRAAEIGSSQANSVAACGGGDREGRC